MNEKTMIPDEKAADFNSEAGVDIATSYETTLPWSKQYTVIWTSKRAVWAGML